MGGKVVRCIGEIERKIKWAMEQEKLETRKMLTIALTSKIIAARCVSLLFVLHSQDCLLRARSVGNDPIVNVLLGKVNRNRINSVATNIIQAPIMSFMIGLLTINSVGA